MNSKIEQSINKFIETYKSRPNLELEIRFKSINKSIFEDLYNKLNESSEFTFNGFEMTINTISESDIRKSDQYGSSNYIRKQTFQYKSPDLGAEKVSDEKIKKTTVVRPIYVHSEINYSINLSEELEDVSFNVKEDSMIRMKIRTSFITSDKKWRIDLTAVKKSDLKSIGPVLKTVISDFFVKLDQKGFIDDLPYNHIDSFEVEVEYVGSPKDLSLSDFKITDKLFTLISPNYSEDIIYQNEIYEIARCILDNRSLLSYFRNKYGLKQLLPQAKTLDKETYYKLYPPDGLYITEKADGERCIISCDKKKCYLIYRNMEEFAKTNSKLKTDDKKIIAEGEYIRDKNIVLLFDVMYFDRLLTKMDLSKRLSYLDSAVEYLESEFGFNSGPGQKKSAKKPEIRKKDFIRLSPDHKTLFEKVWNKKYDYDIDGIIFTNPKEYYEGSYKWKPIEHNTIDFLTVKVPNKLLGIEPFIPKDGHTLYILFVGITYNLQEKLGLTTIPYYNQLFPTVASRTRKSKKYDKSMYNPIQFSPSANYRDYLYYHPDNTSKNISDNNLHYRIVEMKKEPKDGQLGPWVFVRVREDRTVSENYYGNDYRVAELTYMNYIDPLTFEQLYNPQTSYFTKKPDSMYKPANNFRRYVINRFISEYFKDANWIVDLGSGRGADVGKYFAAGVSNVLFTDVDPSAISELIRRKFGITTSKKKQYIFDKNRDRGMSIHTLLVDLKDDFRLLLDYTKNSGLTKPMANGVVCNFAFHYFCDTLDNIRNIIKYISAVMKVGSVIFITVMNGNKIFDKLSGLNKGESWFLTEDAGRKYEIKKLYSGKTISDLGQKIAVKVPFANELYEEPLCNLEFVIKEFELARFNLEVNEPFNNYLNKFSSDNKLGYSQLSEIDIEYSDLFQILSFRKMKNLPKSVLPDEWII